MLRINRAVPVIAEQLLAGRYTPINQSTLSKVFYWF